MSVTEASEQANRAEMDPRRLVVVSYLVFGLILTLVAFPQHARPETLDPSIPTNLVLIYLPITVILQICSTTCLFFYRIDRKQHEDNLQRLAVATVLAEGAEETGLIHP